MIAGTGVAAPVYGICSRDWCAFKVVTISLPSTNILELQAVVLEPDPHLNLKNLKTMDLTTGALHGTASRISSTTFFKSFMDCRVGETLRQIF